MNFELSDKRAKAAQTFQETNVCKTWLSTCRVTVTELPDSTQPHCRLAAYVTQLPDITNLRYRFAV